MTPAGAVGGGMPFVTVIATPKAATIPVAARYPAPASVERVYTIISARGLFLIVALCFVLFGLLLAKTGPASGTNTRAFHSGGKPPARATGRHAVADGTCVRLRFAPTASVALFLSFLSLRRLCSASPLSVVRSTADGEMGGMLRRRVLEIVGSVARLCCCCFDNASRVTPRVLRAVGPQQAGGRTKAGGRVFSFDAASGRSS